MLVTTFDTIWKHKHCLEELLHIIRPYLLKTLILFSVGME